MAAVDVQPEVYRDQVPGDSRFRQARGILWSDRQDRWFAGRVRESAQGGPLLGSPVRYRGAGLARGGRLSIPRSRKEHQRHRLRTVKGDGDLLRASKILTTLVENKPGTLYKVVHLVRLMRLNIEGLTLGVTNGGNTCRMTFTIDGDDATVDHVAKQLRKVIDVIEAQTYTPEEVNTRELALVKVTATDKSKSVIESSGGCRVVDSSPKSLV